MKYLGLIIYVVWLRFVFFLGIFYIEEDYKIGICCFSTKQAALRGKSKDCLVQNQDNVSQWGDISIHSVASVS